MNYLGIELTFHKLINHYNIWGQTMMTMVFDEGILSIKSIPEWVMGILMMWSSTILYIMGLVSTVKGIVDKNQHK